MDEDTLMRCVRQLKKADMNNSNSPLVSIIVPNYNAEEYITQFIECILKQTYNNWELLIVDDNSTDKSPQIVSYYENLDIRIHLLKRSDNNKGACQRRNQGLRAAKGELICFFDSDDLIPDDTIEIRVNEIMSDPNLDFVIVPAISFLKKPFDISRLALGLPLFNDDLGMFIKRFRLPFGVWTNLYRKDFLLKNNIVWDERLSSLQDSDFNMSCLLAGGRYKYSDNQTPGYFWRTGGNVNSITKNIKTQKDLASQLYFYEKLHKRFGSGKYKKDVERFGLTLLNRFALCQAEKEPSILFSRRGRRVKYKLLHLLYTRNTFRKLSPLVNLIFSPFALGEEYIFQIKNRIQNKKYIEKGGARGFLENYTSYDDKKAQYNQYDIIDNIDDLRRLLEAIHQNENVIYRGLSEAKYKMYSSAQRHWIWLDKITQENYASDYNSFINTLISKMKESTAIENYLKQHNIPTTDFLLLSLLQHYRELSPLVDFTFNPYHALFFAADRTKTLDGNIGDYISIYWIETKHDWMQCTIEVINQQGASDADSRIREFTAINSDPLSYQGVIDEMETLKYNNYCDLHFLPIGGPELGITQVSMPFIRKSWTYHNTNPRIEHQEGRFIFNPSSKEPLIERMNRTTKRLMVNCIDIHKSLIPTIHKEILLPKGITQKSMYGDSPESKQLEEIILNLFPHY